MTYWNDHGMNGWGFGLMAVGMLLFWGLVVVAVVLLVRHLVQAPQHPQGTHPSPPPGRIPPEQLLAERFARGEIDADEYRHRLEVLRSGDSPPAG
ncbi:SHOCT domain-containing protein [Streptomyces sp. BE303]|uniref:SHOCT domain-containing protein n=1 Tax=Streptomyces sp. BE303 TaxID=3002528 RepID=UPI002E79D462|nr:SHOCT domain-containing protein [Streptomyces sp. BE303]MED7955073.1 SHOCT domain-containing protein [Streptomyces sp. BE303]